MEGLTTGYTKREYNRNKWLYSTGGIGRDMLYTLVGTFFMTYVQFAIGLTAAQFAAVGVILVISRVWDAVNDLMMGSIIENSRLKWGKFKPWILIGAATCSVLAVLMFNLRPTGWGFVVFFGIIFLLWEAAFTINDISYWSMLPSLSLEKRQRDELATMTVVFANVGMFAAQALIPILTTGNARYAYGLLACVFAAAMLLCQTMTSVFVKENKAIVQPAEENISFKQMFRIIRQNDQLLWVMLSCLLYYVANGLFVALGYNFLYLEIGYDGGKVLIFVLTFAVCNTGAQSLYAMLAKRFSRKKLMLYGTVCALLGYALMLIAGFVPFIPGNIVTFCAFGALIFSGQALLYMVIIVNMTNTIEYNEYKTGERNESIVFSLRPFTQKLSTAIQQIIVVGVLMVTMVYGLSQNISALETQKNLFDRLNAGAQADYLAHVTAIADAGAGGAPADSAAWFEARNITMDELTAQLMMDTQVMSREGLAVAMADAANWMRATYPDPNAQGATMEIRPAADAGFMAQSTLTMRVGLRLGVCLLPGAMIFFAYWLMRKRFIIDEAYYAKMMNEVEKNRLTVASEN